MIHLIVGNTGAGKTTYSNNLKKRAGGVVFSIDKWNSTLFFPDKQESDGVEWILERIEREETMILSLIDQLEENKIDSILDLGLSKYKHREKFREFAMRQGYKVKIHFIDISKEERRRRVFKRNTEKGGTFEFEVTEDDFDFMEKWFERPTEAEMQGGITISE